MSYTRGTLVYDRTNKRYGIVTGIIPDELYPKNIQIQWSNYDKDFGYPKGIFDLMLQEGEFRIIKTENR